MATTLSIDELQRRRDALFSELAAVGDLRRGARPAR